MRTYLSNAFSLNMLERANQRVHLVPVSAAEARGEVYRAYTDVDAGGNRRISSAWRWFRG